MTCLIIYEDFIRKTWKSEVTPNTYSFHDFNPSLGNDMVSEVSTVGPQLFWGIHRGSGRRGRDVGLKPTTQPLEKRLGLKMFFSSPLSSPRFF